jgi:hypothetical protein
MTQRRKVAKDRTGKERVKIGRRSLGAYEKIVLMDSPTAKQPSDFCELGNELLDSIINSAAFSPQAN